MIDSFNTCLLQWRKLDTQISLGPRSVILEDWTDFLIIHRWQFVCQLRVMTTDYVRDIFADLRSQSVGQLAPVAGKPNIQSYRR
jgi:hypothetical protein